jgi:hypothetical protein
MASEADQILCVTDEPVVNDSKGDFEMESNIPVTSSSSNVAPAKMADKTTPKMADYWKKTTITEADHQDYHSFSRLNGGMESSVHTVEYCDVPALKKDD